MESKTFEIEVQDKKGKLQAIIVERKRRISSWVKLGPKSLGFFLECLLLCIKDTRTGKWERRWKENGRSYSLVRDENKGVLSPVRHCGPGEEKLQHLHPERQRSKGWLVFNGRDLTELGCNHWKDRKLVG